MITCKSGTVLIFLIKLIMWDLKDIEKETNKISDLASDILYYIRDVEDNLETLNDTLRNLEKQLEEKEEEIEKLKSKIEELEFLIYN